MSDEVVLGLNNTPKSDWRGNENTISAEALEHIYEDQEYHNFILEFLRSRIKLSERKMKSFYSRWQVAERKLQAYIPASEYENLMEAWRLQEQTDPGKDWESLRYKAPIAMNIVVPYGYATVMTIVTYMLQTFTGARPMFNLGANDGAAEDARLAMETLLQWNADHERLVKELYQYFMDGQTYGVGILRTSWKQERKFRTVWDANVKRREQRTVFQGTACQAVDPFMFLPDPRVPMSRVSRDGEFVFFRSWYGKHTLLAMEAAGEIKGVERAAQMSDSDEDRFTKSLRGMSTTQDAVPGRGDSYGEKVANYLRVDQGTVTLIPQELGLGPETTPQKWIFTVLNGNRVVQAQPFDTDHDMHPCCVIEPYSLGYTFGQPSMMDMVGPLQDVLSWFVNSHMRNVRTAINNMWVVDPSKIEVQDLQNPQPGKMIRLKRAAYGSDVKQALTQLAVTDVTRNHVGDLQVFMRMADALTGVTDNLRGLQDSGGRKTATEVRTTTEAGASRLAAQSRIVSAQGVADLADQMICNFQQYGTDDFVGQVVGANGLASFRIKPEQVTGDFYYSIHDGTLPMDRVQMLDIWKEIFQFVAASPEMAQQYNAGKIFEHVAMLGGVKNLSSFRATPPIMPNMVPGSEEQLARGSASGAVVPAPGPVQSQLMGTRPARL